MTVLQLFPRLLHLFDWAWHTSAKVSVLIILLLLVKAVLKNKISARLHYLLWSVVIVSLLLPWTPQSSFSIYNLAKSDMQQSSMNIGAKSSPILTYANIGGSNELKSTPRQPVAVIQNNSNNNPIIANASPNPSSLISVATSPFTHKVLFFIWIVGIAVFLSATILVNRRFANAIQGQPVYDTKMRIAFEDAKQRLNIKEAIPLFLTKTVTTPSLFGLFHPKLLIPVRILDQFSPVQLSHIFLHELLHFKRKDVLVNWLTQGLLIVHWFNPIFWYAISKMREDQEIACDVKTVEHIGITDPKEYAYTLIKLAESNLRMPRIASLAGLLGSGAQIKRRITMLKILRKASRKWAILVVALVLVMVAVTLTNAKANASNNIKTSSAGSSDAIGAVTSVNAYSGKESMQTTQLSTTPDGSFDYQAYLSFTPLLPSYTAGYQLTLSRISCSQNIPPGSNNSNTYMVAYGNHAAFSVSEARPGDMYQTFMKHTGSDQATKTQIQIGDLPATLTVDKTVDAAYIQFIKDNVEYIVASIPGGGISQDELKKISASITIPTDDPPTDIYIDKMGPMASEGVSFQTLQPEDIIVPAGYEFQHQSSEIYIKGDEKSECFSLYYTKGTSVPFLNVQISKGDGPFGAWAPVLKNTDFVTKQIDGNSVRLRETSNKNLPAAQFTIKNGLLLSIFSTESQSDVEKVVTSILQASAKL